MGKQNEAIQKIRNAFGDGASLYAREYSNVIDKIVKSEELATEQLQLSNDLTTYNNNLLDVKKRIENTPTDLKLRISKVNIQQNIKDTEQKKLEPSHNLFVHGSHIDHQFSYLCSRIKSHVTTVELFNKNTDDIVQELKNGRTFPLWLITWLDIYCDPVKFSGGTTVQRFGHYYQELFASDNEAKKCEAINAIKEQLNNKENKDKLDKLLLLHYAEAYRGAQALFHLYGENGIYVNATLYNMFMKKIAGAYTNLKTHFTTDVTLGNNDKNKIEIASLDPVNIILTSTGKTVGEFGAVWTEWDAKNKKWQLECANYLSATRRIRNEIIGPLNSLRLAVVYGIVFSKQVHETLHTFENPVNTMYFAYLKHPAVFWVFCILSLAIYVPGVIFHGLWFIKHGIIEPLLTKRHVEWSASMKLEAIKRGQQFSNDSVWLALNTATFAFAIIGGATLGFVSNVLIAAALIFDVANIAFWSYWKIKTLEEVQEELAVELLEKINSIRGVSLTAEQKNTLKEELKQGDIATILDNYGVSLSGLKDHEMQTKICELAIQYQETENEIVAVRSDSISAIKKCSVIAASRFCITLTVNILIATGVILASNPIGQVALCVGVGIIFLMLFAGLCQWGYNKYKSYQEDPDDEVELTTFSSNKSTFFQPADVEDTSANGPTIDEPNLQAEGNYTGKNSRQ